MASGTLKVQFFLGNGYQSSSDDSFTAITFMITFASFNLSPSLIRCGGNGVCYIKDGPRMFKVDATKWLTGVETTVSRVNGNHDANWDDFAVPYGGGVYFVKQVRLLYLAFD